MRAAGLFFSSLYLWHHLASPLPGFKANATTHAHPMEERDQRCFAKRGLLDLLLLLLFASHSARSRGRWAAPTKNPVGVPAAWAVRPGGWKAATRCRACLPWLGVLYTEVFPPTLGRLGGKGGEYAPEGRRTLVFYGCCTERTPGTLAVPDLICADSRSVGS